MVPDYHIIIHHQYIIANFLSTYYIQDAVLNMLTH